MRARFPTSTHKCRLSDEARSLHLIRAKSVLNDERNTFAKF
jgi:hypothetical protein